MSRFLLFDMLDSKDSFKTSEKVRIISLETRTNTQQHNDTDDVNLFTKNTRKKNETTKWNRELIKAAVYIRQKD